jgi:hypothetical protein
LAAAAAPAQAPLFSQRVDVAQHPHTTRPTGDDQQLTQPRVVLDDLSV